MLQNITATSELSTKMDLPSMKNGVQNTMVNQEKIEMKETSTATMSPPTEEKKKTVARSPPLDHLVFVAETVGRELVVACQALWKSRTQVETVISDADFAADKANAAKIRTLMKEYLRNNTEYVSPGEYNAPDDVVELYEIIKSFCKNPKGFTVRGERFVCLFFFVFFVFFLQQKLYEFIC